MDGGPLAARDLLGFRNHGGLLGKGVCWWYSRFTRNALYLARFYPDRPPPSRAEARRMISCIMGASAVTCIPGFSCLRDFSAEYHHEIQRVLERRQILEGVFLFAWIDGLAGASGLDPCSMKARMDALFDLSSQGLVYAKFQTPGLDAHAVVVTGMSALPKSGYELRYLDSNCIGEQVLRYRTGYSCLTLSSGLKGVPYPQRMRELHELKRLAAAGHGTDCTAP
ncbi:MAG: hypothetical protein AVO35_12130 [Candidatus Aegiribacteria sp. MLS_C]|nr:MAG: hypothetical protein AVO35_12130 [Candidatus Aegiribacteria sp. MLS_C]